MTATSFSIHGPVAQVTLSRPSAYNALCTDTFRDLDAALDAAAETSVRSVLLVAEGKHFCTGADLQEVRRHLGAPQAMQSFLEAGNAVLNRMASYPKPIVAAVQGMCLAGGLELVLACDLVVAGAGARFGDQHANFGLVPGWNGAARLTTQIGARRARELMMLGTMITAQEALAWGLVNQVAPDETLAEVALKLAQVLAGRSRGGLATMKQMVSDAAASGMSSQSRAAVEQLCSADAAEGLRAFEERRAAVFP